MICCRAARAGSESDNGRGPATSAAGATSPATEQAEPPATTEPTTSETPEATGAAQPKPYPVSLPAYFLREPDGGDLRLGAVRERTAAYTSYDASYRSGHLRVTGVLNIPTGKGPFPAVVLAHGYIDPAIYVSGQGMTRERGYLAAQGFVAFHVDYRNHAGSDDDPLAARRLRTGYALDVINAVQALRRSPRVPVDDDRIGLFGRSMGGGVVYKALEIAPGLVQAATAWASVSSREDENFDHFIRDDGDRDPLVAVRRAGVRTARPARLREVLAADQRPHLLRPDHRAGAARPRQVRLDLPAGLGPRVVPRAPRRRASTRGWRGTPTSTPSARRSSPPWPARQASSAPSC